MVYDGELTTISDWQQIGSDSRRGLRRWGDKKITKYKYRTKRDGTGRRRGAAEAGALKECALKSTALVELEVPCVLWRV